MYTSRYNPQYGSVRIAHAKSCRVIGRVYTPGEVVSEHTRFRLNARFRAAMLRAGLDRMSMGRVLGRGLERKRNAKTLSGKYKRTAHNVAAKVVDAYLRDPELGSARGVMPPLVLLTECLEFLKYRGYEVDQPQYDQSGRLIGFPHEARGLSVTIDYGEPRVTDSEIYSFTRNRLSMGHLDFVRLLHLGELTQNKALLSRMKARSKYKELGAHERLHQPIRQNEIVALYVLLFMHTLGFEVAGIRFGEAGGIVSVPWRLTKEVAL